jgi:hypothetical protein
MEMSFLSSYVQLITGAFVDSNGVEYRINAVDWERSTDRDRTHQVCDLGMTPSCSVRVALTASASMEVLSRRAQSICSSVANLTL